jgi:hypothetical protein
MVTNFNWCSNLELCHYVRGLNWRNRRTRLIQFAPTQDLRAEWTWRGGELKRTPVSWVAGGAKHAGAEVETSARTSWIRASRGRRSIAIEQQAPRTHRAHCIFSAWGGRLSQFSIFAKLVCLIVGVLFFVLTDIYMPSYFAKVLEILGTFVICWVDGWSTLFSHANIILIKIYFERSFVLNLDVEIIVCGLLLPDIWMKNIFSQFFTRFMNEELFLAGLFYQIYEWRNVLANYMWFSPLKTCINLTN